MTPLKLILTRDQIAAFAPDPRTIKQIESLFAIAQGIQESDATGVAFDAGAALAGVNALAGSVAQLAQDAAVDAQTALSTAQAATSALVGLSDAVAGLLLAPPTSGASTDASATSRLRYGAFSDTTTQTAAAINTAYAMKLNTTDLSLGVYVGAPTSRIYVDTAAVYNIQFSAQIDKTSAPVGLLWIWLRINGVDVANSASQIRVQGNNAEMIAAWNFFAQLVGGDYFEIMWAVDSTTIQLQSIAAAAPVPFVPSVILTVNTISR